MKIVGVEFAHARCIAPNLLSDVFGSAQRLLPSLLMHWLSLRAIARHASKLRVYKQL